MKLGIDLDGVVIDTYPAWYNFFKPKFPDVRLEELVHAHANPEYAAFADANLRTLYCDLLSPVPGAVETLGELSRAGHEVHFISARTPLVRDMTVEWLERHGVRFDGLTLLEGADKGLASLAAGVELFVEDAPYNAEAIRAVGVPVLLYDAEYNRGYDAPGVTRVLDWTAIAAYVADFDTLVRRAGASA